MFQYAFARGYAEKHGFRLETDPWIGQEIFEIEDPGISQDFPRMSETEIPDGKGDVSFLSYAQNQMCADFYTKSAVKTWFRLRPKWTYLIPPKHPNPVAHYRGGDYFHAGYPIVGKNSYRHAVKKRGFKTSEIIFCEERDGLECVLEDFLYMRDAGVLFRANSSFSWWAAALGDGVVYSPRIDGLECSKEHDEVPFELGNHCRTADLDFITDIHLKP